VTDANLLLGRLNARGLLDGRMPLHTDAAREALQREVAQPMGLGWEEAAAGVLRIVNVNMMGAVRVISVEQGEDPRGFALVAFGGAGPLHAADVAREMGIGTVLVPPRPGLLSALGLVHADVQGDFSLTRLVIAAPQHLATLNEGLESLAARAADWLRGEGAGTGPAHEERLVEMRYLGQNYELGVPLEDERIAEATLERLTASFHRRHREAYGYDLPGAPVEIVNLRLTVTLRHEAPPPEQAADGNGARRAAPLEKRPVWFFEGGFRDTPIYDRAALTVGSALSGPAVIEQMDTTTVVPPGAHVQVDALGNFVMKLQVPQV
jgi:N-methylhydantoinase A